MSALRVNQSKITAENAFNPDHLWMEGKPESKNESKPSSRYLCWFMSGSLTLRPRKAYVYHIRALFGFCNFLATCCFLQKLGTYSFDSTLNLLSSLCAYTLSLLKSAY